MPEGDTIHKTQKILGPLLEGQLVRAADCRWPRMVQGLVGQRVVAVMAIGKHLLISFSDETTLRVHLGMKGSWHRYDPGEPWMQSPAALGVMLRTDEDEVVCFYPPEVERLRKKEIAVHPVLARLGPDLAVPPVDFDEVMRRARDATREGRPLGDVLLEQQVGCGIGNVYKSEVCFMRRLSPFVRIGDLTDDEVLACFTLASELLANNLGPGMRNTTGQARERLWVYGAMRRACLVCGGRVRHTRYGVDDRITWWCPRCQPEPDAAPVAQRFLGAAEPEYDVVDDLSAMAGADE